MNQILKTPTHLIYLGYFQGKQVRLMKSKTTGEISFNSDDLAKVLGYKDHDDMMKDPKVNEALKQAFSETGKMPIENTILN